VREKQANPFNRKEECIWGKGKRTKLYPHEKKRLQLLPCRKRRGPATVSKEEKKKNRKPRGKKKIGSHVGSLKPLPSLKNFNALSTMGRRRDSPLLSN